MIYLHLQQSNYHVVFTLPHELNPLIMGHRKNLIKLLFEAAAHTLLILGRDERYLGADIGLTTILHTWGQDLSFHPHVHCIVSAGGVKDDKWVKEKRINQIVSEGGWLYIHYGNIKEAKKIIRSVLESEPNHKHSLKIAKKLNPDCSFLGLK